MAAQNVANRDTEFDSVNDPLHFFYHPATHHAAIVATN